jgi:uncharacterized cysteine cluster protein YcgN (CxxCxxCC family)
MNLSLNADICEVIASNFYTIEYELEDWVVKSGKLSYKKLSKNPNAIDFLRKHPKYINYSELSGNKNPEAIKLLRKQIYNISWSSLSLNPSKEAIELLKENRNMIDWYKLSSNINIMSFLETVSDCDDLYKLDWDILSMNCGAIPLLEEYPRDINWKIISKNSKGIELLCERLSRNKRMVDYNNLSLNETPEAIQILRENFKKINWHNLAYNKSQAAIDLMKEYPENIYWDALSANPNAYEILSENQNKICWNVLSANPNPKILKLFTSTTLKKLTRSYFSSNIGACEFLKEHPEYITDEIERMPYIFKPVKKITNSEDIKRALNIVLSV